MDSIEMNNGHVPTFMNEPGTIDLQSDKTGSLDISSEKLDCQDLLSSRQDSPDHSSDIAESLDLSSNKPSISVDYIEKSDSPDITNEESDTRENLSDNTEVLSNTAKVYTPDLFSNNLGKSDIPCNKPGSSVNSSDKAKNPDLSSKNPGSGVSYSVEPVSCDFSKDKAWIDVISSDQPWGRDFSSAFFINKPRRGDFSSDNPWGSNLIRDEPWGSKISSDQTLSGDFSSDLPWGSDFSGDKPESRDFSSEMHENSDLSSDKPDNSDLSSDRPGNLDLLNKPDDSEHSSGSSYNPDNSWAQLEISSDRAISKNLSNSRSGDPDSVTDVSGNASVSSTEFVSVKVSNSCLEDPERSSKSFNSTENLPIEMPLIQSNIVESSGMFSNNPSSCERPIEINNPNFSCNSEKCPDVFRTSSTDTYNDDQMTSCEKATPLEPCVRNVLDKKDLINETKSAAISNKSSEIAAINLNEVGKNPLNTETSYEAMESFSNACEVIVAGGKWKIVKYHLPSNVCVLKCLDEDTQYKFKCIYFNKGTKLDELFKSRSNDELNVSQEEIEECIDSIKKAQSNYIEDHAKPTDQSGFIVDPMGTSIEMTYKDFNCEDDLLMQNGNEVLTKIIEELSNSKFYETLLIKEARENEIVEGVLLDKAMKPSIYDESIFSIELDAHLKTQDCDIVGSKVQDISGCTSSTESINESTTESPNPGNKLDSFSVQQELLNFVDIIWKFLFGLVLCVFTSFFVKVESQSSKECATIETIPEIVTVGDEFQLETDAIAGPSTNTKTTTVSSEIGKCSTQITNFSTLFQHLSATAGTDMTAERVGKIIDSQVVMDIYNGFHELRIVDYGSVDLMSKCIRGCISTLQKTMSKSDTIVHRASVLLRQKTHTLEEVKKLNEDLKDLTTDAEVHMHDIDRALTGLDDFTEDFMYYKDAISKELVEFLLEDFPEIFK